MNVLNKLNLRPKLFILSLVPLLITAVYAGFQFQHEVAGIGEHEVERIRSDLTEARRQELKQYLDIVQSLIAPYYSGDKADDPKAEEKAAELLRRLRYGKDGYVFVYRYDGTNLVYGPKPEVEGKNLWDVSDADGNKVIQDLIGIAKSGSGYYTYQWNKPSKGKAVPKLSYTVGLDKWQWMVGTGFYIDDIDDRIAEVGLQIDDHLNDTLINLGAAFAIALGLTAVFAYFTSCAITRPMCGTARAMKNIAEGDGDLTLRLPVNSTDEVGRLATAFNAFADRMHQAMRQVDAVAGNIASSSDGLYQSTRENSERVNQQRSQTTQIAAAIQEMTSTVQEVAKSAEQAAASAADARSNTEQGQQVISDSVSRIRDLAQGIDHAGETVDALAGESNNIGVVLDVIRGIAEQTNLLALNAAIEAARAGEHGRGFAVVADEVRTLASRTQESTHEIQEMVERLAQGAGKAVKVMQDSKEKVQNTASMAEKAESSLEAIRSTVGVIDDMNAQIATAAEEQGVVAGEINGNVNTIAEFSHATASSSEQVNNASHELSRMGGELRQLVSQFKV